MNKQQCEEFVKKGAPRQADPFPFPFPCPGPHPPPPPPPPPAPASPAALCHAMARDGSSGGVIRTVNIDEAGVERKMVPGNKLPYGPL
jgi:hypothetical protein